MHQWQAPQAAWLDAIVDVATSSNALHDAARRDAYAQLESWHRERPAVQWTSAMCAKDSRGERPLHVAVRSLAQASVEVLVRAGGDLNAKGGGGHSAAHLAAARASPALLHVLLAAGADANARDRGRRTPLHYAASASGAEALACVDLLLRFGAEPHACDADGLPPVLYAAVSSSVRSEADADFGLLRALLARESAGGTAAGALRWLCEQSLAAPADAVLVSVASGFAPPGDSAAIDAFGVEGNRTKVGELLCTRQRRLPRDTPLHAAVRVRSVDVCRVLLRHAASAGCLAAVLGLQNGAEAMTPLQLACHVSDGDGDGTFMPGSETVALLSSIDKMMSDVGVLTNRSSVAPSPALGHARGTIVSLLLESGASTRVSPPSDAAREAARRARVDFTSPLALAITAGHIDAVTLLLTAGAEIDEDVKSHQEPRAARFEGECPVCLEASKNCVRLARCRHLLCESCMMKMLSFKADATCPLCRAEII